MRATVKYCQEINLKIPTPDSWKIPPTNPNFQNTTHKNIIHPTLNIPRNPKSMIHLIFIVVLAGWHNLLLSARIAISKLDLCAGPDEQDQQLLSNAVLLNTSVKSKKLVWENPAAASAYTSRSVTVLSPATNPSALQYYLGRKTTFSMTKQRAIHLQTGGGSRFFTEPHCKEFYDQPKAPLPPPAPNISLQRSSQYLATSSASTSTILTLGDLIQ